MQKILANSTSRWWFQSSIYILPVHWAGFVISYIIYNLLQWFGGGGRACIIFSPPLIQHSSNFHPPPLFFLLSRNLSALEIRKIFFFSLSLQAMNFFKNSCPEFQRSTEVNRVLHSVWRQLLAHCLQWSIIHEGFFGGSEGKESAFNKSSIKGKSHK